MGEVYLAEDTRLDRKVALKILPNEFTRDDERLRRFTQEAKAASALNHPNIITIHDIGQESGHHYIATEFIEGETLRDHMHRSRMSTYEVLDVASQIASALSAAHRAGIVHRDMKPENVMIRPDGLVKVLDFGIAKLTRVQAPATDTQGSPAIPVQTEPGLLMGTPSYMSPEQARGVTVDSRSDIFSLGAVMYEMVAGKRAFEGETVGDVLVSILEREPTPLSQYSPDVPVELQRIVSKALRKDREQRYRTAYELLTELKKLSNSLIAPTNEKGPSARSMGDATTEAIGATDVRLSPSIAVLPFNNMSPDAENEYFCDGLAEELLNALSKVGGLRVAARTSSFSFKGKQVDVREIGQRLKVSTILEGSVRKIGSRLRITAQLINAADGYHLWSERYDRQMEDIFEIQDDITVSIVDSLRVKLLSNEKALLLKRYTDNSEAYQLYVKGRYFWNKRTGQTIKEAIEYFEQALNIDPNYALAYAGLADSYELLGFYNILPQNEAYSKARIAATKALEIDDMLAEAHTALADVKFSYDRDWSGAERGFRRAIEINPNYATARQWYANYLTAMGRHTEAISEITRAQMIDPLSLIVNANVGSTLYYAREYERAKEQCLKALEMDMNFIPTHWILGMVYERKGMYAEAIAEFQKAISLSERSPIMLAALGHAYAASLNKGEAQNVLSELKVLSNKQRVSLLEIAAIYAELGEKDQALAWLENAYEERAPLLPFLKVEPKFDPLRSDPRFQDLLSRVGFR